MGKVKQSHFKGEKKRICHKELDTTERLHFHFSLSCIGEGNGNPLQCSCLENPRDGGAWWAAVSGVARSRTRPKRLSSSSSSRAVCGLPRWCSSKYHPLMRETQETWVQSLGQEDLPEKEMAILQHTFLENSMDRRTWQATVQGVAENQT